MSELERVGKALVLLSKYAPCPHETADFSLGTGTYWARCEDCGATFEQRNVDEIKQRCLDFDEALHVFVAVHEELLDEYAKQGDPRGALGPAWVYGHTSAGEHEWVCTSLEMYVTQRNDEEGKEIWCFGYMGCEELDDALGPRDGMKLAEKWNREHPPEPPKMEYPVLDMTTFNRKEMIVLQRIATGDLSGSKFAEGGDYGILCQGLTTDEWQALCTKLGI